MQIIIRIHVLFSHNFSIISFKIIFFFRFFFYLFQTLHIFLLERQKFCFFLLFIETTYLIFFLNKTNVHVLWSVTLAIFVNIYKFKFLNILDISKLKIQFTFYEIEISKTKIKQKVLIIF